jgi:peroxiredoxin
MSTETAVKVGDQAPDFTLRGIGGKEHTLSEYRGKKSVLLLFYVLDWTPG